MSSTHPPLSGIRVLSLAEQLPGPYATLLLADLGADVILVERPGTGDPSRRFEGLFTALNRNKRSVALDLKAEAGRQQFLNLVDSADVVMEGFRPGVMKRLGLDADTLRQRKPSLVYASISAFGQDGPLASVAGHDLSIQAAAGLIQVPPGMESRSAVPMLPLADIASGMFAALGVVTALLQRERGPERTGRTLDISMLDSLISWMTPFLVPPMNGMPVRELPPREPAYGVFGTRDGRQLTLSIAGEDAMWRSLCELLGLHAHAALSESQREAATLDIDPRLREAIANWDCQELQAALAQRGIAFGPVVAVDQVLQAEQVVRRELVARGIGERQQRFVRQPIRFDDSHFDILRAAPRLGEHTDELVAQNGGNTTAS